MAHGMIQGPESSKLLVTLGKDDRMTLAEAASEFRVVVPGLIDATDDRNVQRRIIQNRGWSKKASIKGMGIERNTQNQKSDQRGDDSSVHVLS
jgi:hypothetical protein